MKSSVKSLLVVLVIGVFTVAGFPDGAPVDACVRTPPNQPNHGQAKPQPPQTNPFQILQSGAQYGPGTQITGNKKFLRRQNINFQKLGGAA